MYLSLNSETYRKQKDLLRMRDLFFGGQKLSALSKTEFSPFLLGVN